MGRRKEYIPCRYDPGTLKRVEGLADYIGGECLRKSKDPDEVEVSESMRELVGFALDVFERRAKVWRQEREEL